VCILLPTGSGKDCYWCKNNRNGKSTS